MSFSSALQSALISSTALEKMQIFYETSTPGVYGPEPITALFNPASLRFSKDVVWKIAPITGQSTLAGYHQISFCASNPRKLTVELFFDSYEGDPPSLTAASVMQQALAQVKPMNPLIRTPSGVSVRRWTQPIVELAMVQNELHQPPLCLLAWGPSAWFEGVLTSLNEDFTMFLADGTPVRATLTCVFTEASDPGQSLNIRELHSADIWKQYVLRRGDTLSSVAQAMYNDASQWRLIATANGIANPRDLTPYLGKVLSIPRLTE